MAGLQGKRYVVYLRVSTKEQEERKNGLDAQEHGARSYAESLGGNVMAVKADAVSGAALLRPGLHAALELVRDTGADLVIWELDRLGRNAAHLLAVRDALQRHGSSIHVASQRRILDVVTYSVLAAMAESERDRIAKRVREGLEARERRTGKRNGAGKGFDTSKAREVSKRERRKSAMDKTLVARNFIEMELERGSSFSEIAKGLNRLGIPTPKGKDWFPASVHRVASLHGLLGEKASEEKEQS